jgi:hypothetical protein
MQRIIVVVKFSNDCPRAVEDISHGVDHERGRRMAHRVEQAARPPWCLDDVGNVTQKLAVLSQNIALDV